jgi:hypothetical protein
LAQLVETVLRPASHIPPAVARHINQPWRISGERQMGRKVVFCSSVGACSHSAASLTLNLTHSTSSVCSAALPSSPFISFRLPSRSKIIYSRVPSKLTLHLGSPRPSPHDGTLTQPGAQSPTTTWVWFRASSFAGVYRRETRQRIFLLPLN